MSRITLESQAYGIAQRGGCGAVTAVTIGASVAFFTNFDDAVTFANVETEDTGKGAELTDYYTGKVWQLIAP